MRDGWLVCMTSCEILAKWFKSAFQNASIMEATDNKEIPDENPFKHLSE